MVLDLLVIHHKWNRGAPYKWPKMNGDRTWGKKKPHVGPVVTGRGPS